MVRSSGPVRSGPVWSCPGPVQSGLVWTGPVHSSWSGQVRSGLVFGPVRPVWSSLDLRSGPWSGPAGAVHVLLVGTPHCVGWYIVSCPHLCDNKKGNENLILPLFR